MKKEVTTVEKTVAVETEKPVAKAPAKKAATKKAVEKKVEEVKAEPAAAKEEKTEAKKAPAKKTPAKKTATKTEKKTSLVVQYYGKEVTEEEIIEKVKSAYTAETGKKATSIKELTVYVKPEEDAAYYVVNGKAAGRVSL